MLPSSARRGAAVLVFLAGCGPSLHEQELRAVQGSLRALQSQLARMDERVEALSHRVAVLSDRSAPTRAESTEAEPPRLEVVRLAPAPQQQAPEPEADGGEEGPVVEIKLDQSTGVPALAVVDVPPHPVELAAASPDGAAAERQFKRALESYQAGRAALAYAQFARFVRDHPRHEHADNAQYWMGECQLELGKLDAAVTELSRVLERYPRSTKAPDALMKLGSAYERQGKLDAARHSFEKLLDEYPDNALAELARARLDALPATARAQR